MSLGIGLKFMIMIWVEEKTSLVIVILSKEKKTFWVEEITSLIIVILSKEKFLSKEKKTFRVEEKGWQSQKV